MNSSIKRTKNNVDKSNRHRIVAEYLESWSRIPVSENQNSPTPLNLGNKTLHQLDLIRETVRANIVSQIVSELNSALLEDNINSIQNASLSAMKNIMSRLVKGNYSIAFSLFFDSNNVVEGKIGAMLDAWHLNTHADLKKHAEMERQLRQVEAASYAGREKMSGMQQMKQIMVRMVKYNTAQRVDIWKQNLMIDHLIVEMEAIANRKFSPFNPECPTSDSTSQPKP